MHGEPLLEAVALNYYFGALAASDNFDLQIFPGELHALIGPNGAGKTTAVKQLSGELLPQSGQIRWNGQDITRMAQYKRVFLGLARSFQITSLFEEFTVLENAILAVQAHRGHSFHFWHDVAKDPAMLEPAHALLQRTGLEDCYARRVDTLAHGQKRRMELSLSLAGQPQLLLLDEPMSGSGVEAAGEMLDLLQNLKGQMTIVLIEHDMDAVFSLADRITVMVSGRTIACDTPQRIRNNPLVQHAYLGDV